VRALLAKSGFELLFHRAPATNAVWLKKQRRMPPEIASFISAVFYRNELETEHGGTSPDSVFNSPFAMADTSDLAARQRAETAMQGRGEAISHGYRNELEARLIARLLQRYEREYQDWAVIVPFNAQKELVIEQLKAALGPAAEIADNVGSVDSFQGGERDLIIFGFTRSNPNGDIGFLSELRRFNVAVSRARQQLILVGDLSTLSRAKHPGFRGVIEAMIAHLEVVGDRRPSRELAAALKEPQGQDL
jgi:superfamily I DNA and/or RNA helicase